METWKRRMGKGETDRAAGRALRRQRKSPEQLGAAPNWPGGPQGSPL